MSQDAKWEEIISEGALLAYQKMMLTYKREKKSLQMYEGNDDNKQKLQSSW